MYGILTSFSYVSERLLFFRKKILFCFYRKEELKKLYDLLYIFSNPIFFIPFERAKLVDKKVIFKMDSLRKCNVNLSIKRWLSSDVSEDLVSLALTSGKYSRFRIDPKFTDGSFERLYTKWIEQSVNKTIATDVFCYMIDNCPRGLLTLDLKPGNSVIGLISVDERFHHKGIGTALIQHAISYVYEYGGTSISVATQMDNVAACQFYTKCGFSIESVNSIWHWWL